MKRCKSCVFYPNDCGYWDKKYRKKHPQAGFVSEDTAHNCPDYIKKEEKAKKLSRT